MQLVAERQSTATIRAKLNYIVDTGVPPVSYIDWPEEAHNAVPAQYQLHDVTGGSLGGGLVTKMFDWAMTRGA